MDSNVKFLGAKQKCEEFLAFTSLEVRFLVDSSSCSNNKSFTNAIVMMIPYFFDKTPPSNSSRSNTRHTHTYANTTITGLALGLFVLYNSFLWLIAELSGCVYYCQHQTVVAVSYVPYPAVVDVCGLSNEINSSLE